MAFRNSKALTENELYELLMNSDEEDELIQTDDETDVSISEDEENLENISAVINSQRIDATEVISVADLGEPSKKKQKKDKNPHADKFKWEQKDLTPTIHIFNNDESGVKIQLPDAPTALEIFEHFFSTEILDQIVAETNAYHDLRNIEENNGPSHSRANQWAPVTVEELYVFLGLTLLMPLVHKQRIQDYWTKDLVIETPFFRQVMSRDRYLAILSTLHFCNNNNVDKNDRLFKIRIIVDHFRKMFREGMYPFENVALDESLILFKGRLSFRQYIPSKRHRFGIKFFVVADCETGYILDFLIYTGAPNDMKVFDEDLKKGGNIVMTLLEPYFNKGHTLYIDNWYTSPILAYTLFDKKTNVCGTVKPTRLYMPTFPKNIDVGDVKYFSTDRLLTLRWQDKKEVTMLTSCHTADKKKRVNKRGIEVEKPECIFDYNQYMGAIDRSDMLLSSTESVRKTTKWYKKIFFHLLDVSVLNAHSTYKTKTGEHISLLDFQTQLVKEIFEKYKRITPRPTSHRPDLGHNPLRLIERHFPQLNTQCPEQKKRPSNKCVVCSKNKHRRDTVYHCAPCNVPLCVVPCFERYHTVKRF